MFVFDMTKKEACDRIIEYFSRPGAVLAVDDQNHCYYRMPDGSGHACAVGCLIPDDQYNTIMDDLRGDSQDVRELVDNGLVSCIDCSMLCFLSMIQENHDGAASVDAFLDYMYSIRGALDE